LPPGVENEAKHSGDVTLEERHSERERKNRGGIVTVIGWQLSCASIREVTTKG